MLKRRRSRRTAKKKEDEIITDDLADGFRHGLGRLLNYYERREDRHNHYYLFVYPEGTQFDNQVISGENAANQIKTKAIRVNEHVGVFKKNKHLTIVDFWAISLVAHEDNKTDKFSAKADVDNYDL